MECLAQARRVPSASTKRPLGMPRLGAATVDTAASMTGGRARSATADLILCPEMHIRANVQYRGRRQDDKQKPRRSFGRRAPAQASSQLWTPGALRLTWSETAAHAQDYRLLCPPGLFSLGLEVQEGALHCTTSRASTTKNSETRDEF